MPTFDLAAFAGINTDTPVQTLAAGGRGALLTGVLKAAQWAAVELLTPQGTLPLDDPDRGTALVAALLHGAVRTETDGFVAFGLAAGRVIARARRIEPVGLPDDERIVGLDLRSIAFATGAVTLEVAVTTAAGTSRTLILPIAAPPPG